MTDIDVSECEYYKGYCRISSLCDYSGHICETTTECYYKQLKKLEQLLYAAEQSEQEASEIIAELKAENKKLKEKLEKIKEAITTCLTFHSCQKCKFYNECEMSLEEFILEIIRGEE